MGFVRVRAIENTHDFNQRALESGETYVVDSGLYLANKSNFVLLEGDVEEDTITPDSGAEGVSDIPITPKEATPARFSKKNKESKKSPF